MAVRSEAAVRTGRSGRPPRTRAALPGRDDLHVVTFRVGVAVQFQGRVRGNDAAWAQPRGRQEAVNMRSRRDEGLVEVRGRGRGAHYVPGQSSVGRSSRP